MIHDRHYTLEEANAELERIAPMLETLREAKDRLLDEDAREVLTEAAPTNGGGAPGKQVGEAFLEVRSILVELTELGIVVRDVDRGLIDVPSIREGERSTSAGSSARRRSPGGTRSSPGSTGAARSTERRLAPAGPGRPALEPPMADVTQSELDRIAGRIDGEGREVPGDEPIENPGPPEQAPDEGPGEDPVSEPHPDEPGVSPDGEAGPAENPGI